VFKIPAKINKKIGKAMHDYQMFADNDRVLIAVSGGVDSLTLAALLATWREKLPIHLDFVTMHVDHGFWRTLPVCTPPQTAIGTQLQRFGLDLAVVEEWRIDAEQRTCFQCARNRRSQLFDLARLHNCRTVAFGHHRDDLIETFFLNALYGGNISTMRPRQELFGGNLAIVRPLAYLEKNEVTELAAMLRLRPVKNLCPLADTTRREKVRNLLEQFFTTEPGCRDSVFAALKNVRREYLP
jgi:tRNA 2-thiocytidine biosynthesis protein TtcA